MYTCYFLVLFCFCTLAKSTFHNQLKKRIINGRNETAQQAPYYAMLYRGGVHSGGVIIRDKVILTAASVVDGIKDDEIEIFVAIDYIGLTYIRFPYNNNRTIIHPNYEYGNANFDCALLMLVDPLGMGGNVQTIDISLTRPPVNSVATISGFGYPQCNASDDANERCTGEASRFLLEGNFTIDRYSNNTMYARGLDGVNSCFGDFGGPVVYEDQLVGIVCLVQFADCTGYSLVLSLPGVSDWIEDTIRTEGGGSKRNSRHKKANKFVKKHKKHH